jgi:CelD/BcsL family acetyltransferase involved in cellulose biosynthesis
VTPFTRLDSYQGAWAHWESLLPGSIANTFFMTPQWQQAWWEQFGDGTEMMLLGLEEHGGVTCIAPLARRDRTISFVGGQDLFDYNDFLVSPGSEDSFYTSLMDHLDDEDWDTVDLSSLQGGSPTLSYVPDLAERRGYSVQVEEEDVAPALMLPADWDSYLGLLSKKDRHELRRKLRRLESSGEETRYYKLSDPVEVEAGLDDFFSLMRFSKETKDSFLTAGRESFFRSAALAMAGIGVFRLFFLEFNQERVAAAMCFDYGDTRHLYNSGFNPEYRYYSVGLLLKALCVKDAIEEGKACFDFLRGAEPYKYDLGGKDRTIYHMVVRRS